MAIIFNGTSIPASGNFLTINGTAIDTVIANGVTVWKKITEEQLHMPNTSISIAETTIQINPWKYSFGAIGNGTVYRSITVNAAHAWGYQLHRGCWYDLGIGINDSNGSVVAYASVGRPSCDWQDDSVCTPVNIDNQRLTLNLPNTNDTFYLFGGVVNCDPSYSGIGGYDVTISNPVQLMRR